MCFEQEEQHLPTRWFTLNCIMTMACQLFHAIIIIVGLHDYHQSVATTKSWLFVKSYGMVQWFTNFWRYFLIHFFQTITTAGLCSAASARNHGLRSLSLTIRGISYLICLGCPIDLKNSERVTYSQSSVMRTVPISTEKITTYT